MASIPRVIKPASGFSHFVHIILVLALPVLVFILVRLNFVEIAAAVILLSKWRMIAVKPRHWPANIRANAVDIIFGLSILIFMISSGSELAQVLWTVVYAIWLTVLKPGTSLLSVSFQALIAQSFGLSALFLYWGDSSLLVLVLLSWLICYACARHFFTSFEEPLTGYLSYAWAFIAACMTWVLGHWLLFYGVIAQPTLLLTVISFSLGSIYYLTEHDRLSVFMRRQLLFVMFAIIIVVLAFSKWGYNA